MSIVLVESKSVEDLQKELLELERIEAELDSKLEDTTTYIDLARSELNHKCSSLIDKYEEWQAKFEYINREALNRAREKANLKLTEEEIDKILEMTRDSSVKSEDVISEVLNEEVVAQKLDIHKECKKLYQRIAAKCHPDKTPDAVLHKLFIDAKNSYKIHDLEGLKYYVQCMEEQVNSNSEEFLSRRLRRSQNKIKSRMAILKSILESEEFQIVQMFRSPMPKVSDHGTYLYRRKLSGMVTSLEIKVTQLIHKTGIYPP